ncbi:MAG: hypothetical protein ACLR0U_18555 [Enterocloster clostridioformis]
MEGGHVSAPRSPAAPLLAEQAHPLRPCTPGGFGTSFRCDKYMVRETVELAH